MGIISKIGSKNFTIENKGLMYLSTPTLAERYNITDGNAGRINVNADQVNELIDLLETARELFSKGDSIEILNKRSDGSGG